MKKPYIKLLGLIVIVIAVGLIFTALKSSNKYKFKKSAVELHKQLAESTYFIDPNTAWEVLSKKNDDYIFVDIRTPHEYENFHIEGAVNVPMQTVLDDQYIPNLKNDKKKVLYSNESIKADQIRLLLTQYGYDNLYVLQGGAKYWKENMVTKDVFKSKSEYDDEKLKFDVKKAKAGK